MNASTSIRRRIGWLIGAGALLVAAAAVAVWLLAGSAGDVPDAGGEAGSAGTAASEEPPSTPGPLPSAAPTSGSEVQEPTGDSGYTLPPVTSSAPLVSGPLPETASAQGHLVEGFPEDVVPPMERSTVVTSSITSDEGRMQVTLVGHVEAPAADVVAFYRDRWSSLGLRDLGGPDGSVAFTGAYESLTLAVITTGTGVQYSVSAVFRIE
ncbi:hypothetical protein M2317_002633 [Microbacterium sp. ZKA21]|uniref:hypothetical protein n=1 Tax=Microbacterium sp. ZKA21 TaxID=3381694 RepID=UPI003D22E475